MTPARTQLVKQIAAWREIHESIAARQVYTDQPFRAELRRAAAHISDLEGELGDYDRIHSMTDDEPTTEAQSNG